MITKNTDKRKALNIKKALRKIFEEDFDANEKSDFDENSQIKDLGNSFSGPIYENACRAIFEKLRNDLQQNKFYK